MLNIPMNTEEPYSRDSLQSINNRRVLGAVTSQNVETINRTYTSQGAVGQVNPPPYQQPQFTQAQPVYQQSQYMQSQPTYQQPVQPPFTQPQHVTNQPEPFQSQYAQPAPVPLVDRPVPELLNPMRKGQKLPLEASGRLSAVKVCLGWNVKRAECELDVSAFLLDSSGKVPGDDWFVFYGQTTSPDGSCVFSADGGSSDREIITVDFNRLNAGISKIVFVLTINDALEKHLNFSMVKDAYIRIFDNLTGVNIVSFMLEDYYANVTSMMIGELYIHNGAWKFNAVGSGVARDLAGLCELYGVQVI